MKMFFRTDEEKKSAIVTTVLFVIMVLIMSIAIFPPEVKELEGGGGGGTIALNFGFDDEGMGDNFTSAERVSLRSETTTSSDRENEMLTSDNEDAVAIKDVPKKDDKQPETKPTTNKPATTVPTTPQPDKNVTDAIGNLLGGDGNTNKQGNQGSSTGNLDNSGYDGEGGSGTGSGGGHGSGQGIGTGSGYGSGSGAGSGSGHGNYSLAGRKSIAMPTPQYNCNEEGTVVVEISVDKTGKVIGAKPGARGTTNTAKCLVDVARQAAMQSKFDPSTTAPERQVGTITYNFRLRD